MPVLGSSSSGIFLSQSVFLVSLNSICSYFSLPFSFMFIFKCSLRPIFLSFLGLFLALIFSLLIIGELSASSHIKNSSSDLITSLPWLHKDVVCFELCVCEYVTEWGVCVFTGVPTEATRSSEAGFSGNCDPPNMDPLRKIQKLFISLNDWAISPRAHFLDLNAFL